MHTLNHQIRAALNSRLRKFSVSKRKMRSMCLIHNQGNSVRMNNFCNFFNIRYNSIIRRRNDQNCFCIRITIQALFHIFRKNSALYPHFFNNLWINIIHIRIHEDNSVISRFVAVTAHENPSSRTHCSADAAENSAGASIHQIPCFIGAIYPGCPFHRFLQNSLRMMKIIKSVYFCNINRKRIGKFSCQPAFLTALVARHMARHLIRFSVIP